MTALQHPARTQPRRVPFTVVDEVTRHCLHPRTPETVHIEVHLPGRPDPARLRAAFNEALQRHPRILMREAPGPWYRRRYEWELTPHPDTDVVTFLPPTPHALTQARARALSVAPPLTLSPPVRLEVIDRVLLLTINHTALDGPACLRVLATTAEIYGGQNNNPTPTTSTTTRTTTTNPRTRTRTRTHLTPVARVAPGTPTSTAPNGMLITELPLPTRPTNASYTVNDQLMVATARTIAAWNREHGSPPRPMRITMPVDDRSRGMDMPIGNGTRLVEVPFSPTDLTETPDIPALLRRTALRTRTLKALPRPQLGHGAALLTAPVLPVGLRAALTRTLRRTVTPWTSTTLLSNIGRIAYPLDFGEGTGRATAVWFSAPARMPRGLTVTTASTAGRLHLALRWSGVLLGERDGERLRDLFTEYLDATSGGKP